MTLSMTDPGGAHLKVHIPSPVRPESHAILTRLVLLAGCRKIGVVYKEGRSQGLSLGG